MSSWRNQIRVARGFADTSSTWRTLNPLLEDRPLALCDSRSVDPDDLVATVRIIPNAVGEVYYLTFISKHTWFWLEDQTPLEPFAFAMYVTKAGSHDRRMFKILLSKHGALTTVGVCPHVFFVNPGAPKDASPRESIETRSIVITKE